MSKNYNKYTGEVMAFRSQYHMSDYCDNEVIDEPSMTDASDYEDINDTIAKCARRGILKDLAKVYENGSNEKVDFDDYDETQDSDYDICQAKQTYDEILNKVSSSNSSLGEEVQTATSAPSNAGAVAGDDKDKQTNDVA